MDLLIIDDFGMTPLRSPHDEDFHELIAERYERTTTLVTSNLDLNEWVDASRAIACSAIAGPTRLRRQRAEQGLPAVNLKRVYRVMRIHGLLLRRPWPPPRPRHKHTGRVAVDHSSQRWCSGGFKFRCDDGEPVRTTFVLDCCDCEAMSWVASTGGYTGDDVHDVILAAVEHCFGTDLPAEPIQWLSDNGSVYADPPLCS